MNQVFAVIKPPSKLFLPVYNRFGFFSSIKGTLLALGINCNIFLPPGPAQV